MQTSSILGVADHLRRAGTFDEHYGWTQCLFGSQAHPGDFHYTGFTELSLKVYIAAAGFELREFSVNDGWLFAVSCIKTVDWRAPLRAGGSDEEFLQTAFAHACEGEVTSEVDQCLRTALADHASRETVLRTLFGSANRLHYIAQRLQ